MSNTANWTGERLETFIHTDATVEHLHRYSLAIDFVKDKVVLDIASGEGYGTNLISTYAKKVFGVDIDSETIKNAHEKYNKSNIEFKVGSASSIPLPDSSVDVVVSFETLEHHDQHHEMMAEIKRVLTDEGILIISTPDKKNYSDLRGYQNPYHVKELYYDEFKNLMLTHFNSCSLFLQNYMHCSLIVPENARGQSFCYYEGDYERINLSANFTPMYIIAIASNTTLNCVINASAFASPEVQRIYQAEINSQMRESGANWIRNSLSYRLGSFILAPFKFFQKKG